MSKLSKAEELKALLIGKFTEEQIDKFISEIKPFYDFYDFMLEKHGMTFEQVEEDSGNFSQSVLGEYLEQMSKSESPLKFMVEISGDIIKRYANKYDYEMSEDVKIALNKYMEFLMVAKISKN